MLGVLFVSICTNSGAKLYHFVISTKYLLTFLALKFILSDTLLDFQSFSLHFENYHILSPPHSLHIVILLKNQGRCVRTQRPWFYTLLYILHYTRLSANCSRSGTSVDFMRERMVTIGSTISQSFMASIIERITLPAVGAQLPFSMIPNLRFW